tara:strand:- start:23602 stop:24081 length:480 start_codon:yes stop_codon:yes gene_type:complete
MFCDDGLFRKEIVQIAQDWIGTPYQHQASAIGHGCDCLGLIRGIWREAVGPEPAKRPTYSPDWFQRDGEDLLLNTLESNFQQVRIDTSQGGDVVAFRLRKNGLVKHVGITVGHINGLAQMIHSYSNNGVVLSPIGNSWRRRCAGQFQFPRRVEEWQRFY